MWYWHTFMETKTNKMKTKNISLAELNEALILTNKLTGYKLTWNRFPEKQGNYYHFTIRSEKSGIPGARRTSSGRNLVSASWHAHGYLFDAILSVCPDAIIIVSGNKKIYKDDNGKTIGNWEDIEVGSLYRPCYMSETDIL